MKSKAPLALMEQMVMLLVFALAAGLCLQAFVKSDQISLRSQAKSNAALAAQNMAEIIRHSGGSVGHALLEAADRQGGRYLEDSGAGSGVMIFYDEEWNPVDENGTYLLTAREVRTEEDGLEKVSVQVAERSADITEQTVFEEFGEKELLFELETAWLEVNGHE